MRQVLQLRDVVCHTGHERTRTKTIQFVRRKLLDFAVEVTAHQKTRAFRTSAGKNIASNRRKRRQYNDGEHDSGCSQYVIHVVVFYTDVDNIGEQGGLQEIGK